MATVTITVRDGSLTIVPPHVKISPKDLSITWNLSPADGWQFAPASQGIVCETAVKPPFQPWSGAPAAPGAGPNQYTAKGAAVAASTRHKYSINLVNGGGQTMAIDPEILNEPQP